MQKRNIVIATIAAATLVAAVGTGGAEAAGRHLLGSKDIKDHSLQVKDISPAAVASLRGKTGARGPVGATGAAGAPGAKGDKGDTGLTGPAGPAGAPGAAAAKGDKGDKGDTGLTGPAGPAGPAGPKGDAGAPGAKGATGVLGVYTRTDSATVLPAGGGNASANVACDAGDIATGGGAASHGSDVALFENLPDFIDEARPTIPTGWMVRAHVGAAAVAPGLDVWVVCAKIAS